MIGSDYLWPGRFHDRHHISTRQYGRMLKDWVASIGLEPSAYGSHSMRRTKAAQIYKKTGNLRAVQLLLGHTKMDSTVRYLGIELEDALARSAVRSSAPHPSLHSQARERAACRPGLPLPLPASDLGSVVALPPCAPD